MKATSLIVLALCLLPVAALSPRPSRSVARGLRSICPTITVECPEEMTRVGVPISFNAKMRGGGPSRNLTFKWTTSAGTIASGAEGTVTTPDADWTAVVDTTGLPHNTTVTATVDLVGLDRSCAASASCWTQLQGIADHFPADEYGNIKFNDEKARLDNYAIGLKSGSEFDGYIICYGGRRGRRGEARARCARAKNYLVTRHKIPAERIVTVDGGYREELTVVLWPLPRGAELTPSPTVDPSEVEFIGETEKRRARRPRRRL